MKKFLLSILAFSALVGVVQARTVSGEVVSDQEGLGGVIVTDGTNFTQTRKNGKFSFEIEDDAEFVYIVTPKGYVADWSSGVPAFYQEAAGKDSFTFDLMRTDDSGDYSIIAVSDPQTKNKKHLSQFAALPMDDLCSTASHLEGAAVGLVLGDICWDSLELLEDYKKEIVRTGIPFYPVVGNHDHEREAKGDLQTTAAYRKIMGPENYAFFLGDDVVIVVDNIIYDTQKKYVEGYADHVLSWVEGLVKRLPKKSRIYVAQHSVLDKWFAKDRKIENSAEMIDILSGHDVLFISGHTHINNNMNYAERVAEHNVAAICGAWWDTYYCTDGTPSGYKVYISKDGNLEWYYKSLGKDKDYQVEIYEPGQSEMYPGCILVNVWDWDPEWKVEWTQDGRHMGVLDPVIAMSPEYVKEIGAVFQDRKIPRYKQPRFNWHYFAAAPDKSAKMVEIIVTGRFGQKWVYEVDLSRHSDVLGSGFSANPQHKELMETLKQDGMY